MAEGRDSCHADQLGRVRAVIVAGTMAATVLAASVGGLVGPGLIRMIVGQGVQLGSLPAMLVAVGSVVAVAQPAHERQPDGP